jgi:hypothetical protein
MRMRSTGLGKTELVGRIDDMTRAGDYLILHVGTTEPVRWHVRTAVSMGDLFRIAVLILKPSNLLFILTHLYNPNPKVSPEY